MKKLGIVLPGPLSVSKDLATLASYYAALVCSDRFRPGLTTDDDFAYLALGMFNLLGWDLSARLTALPLPRASRPGVPLPDVSLASNDQLVAGILYAALLAAQRFAPFALKNSTWLKAGAYLFDSYSWPKLVGTSIKPVALSGPLELAWDTADVSHKDGVASLVGDLPLPDAVTINHFVTATLYMLLVAVDRVKPGDVTPAQYRALGRDVFLSFGWPLPAVLV